MAEFLPSAKDACGWAGGTWDEANQKCNLSAPGTPGTPPAPPGVVVPVCIKPGEYDELKTRVPKMHLYGWAAAAFAIGYLVASK